MNTSGKTLMDRLRSPAWIGASFFLLNFIGVGAYKPYLFVYLQDIGLTGRQLGLLSVFDPVLMLFAFPIAALADRKNWRVRIAQVAVLGSSITIFIMQFADEYFGIMLLMLLLAVFTSPNMSIADGMIARMAKRHNLNYGSMRLWGSFGFAASSLAFGALWDQIGYVNMFTIAGLLLFPMVIIAGRLEEGAVNSTDERKPLSVLFKDTGLMLVIGATFLSGVSNSMSMNYSGILVDSMGGGNFLIGMVIAGSCIAELPSMHFSLNIARKLKPINTLLLSYVLMGLAYTGYIYAWAPEWLPVFAAVKGFGYGLWHTITVLVVTQRTPDEWAASAQTLIGVSMFGLAPLVAGPIGGLLLDTQGAAAPFWFGNITLIMAFLLLFGASRAGKIE